MRGSKRRAARPSKPCWIVVIGGSAGSIEAISRLLGALPKDLPAAVLVCIHRSGPGGAMAAVIGRESRLAVADAVDGEPIVPGRVYVAPADRHLIVESEHLRVTRGPRENKSRPAVDPLFRTAARFHGPRVIGIVFSGWLDCGTYGLLSIKRYGGRAIVQDPDEAPVPSMPLNALQEVDADHVLPVDDMPALLAKLVAGPVPDMLVAVPIDAAADPTTEAGRILAPVVCPECSGPLFEAKDEIVRYRCRVGHAYTEKALVDGKSGAIETALWIALNSLDEKAALCRRLEKRARENGHATTAKTWEEQAEESEQQAALVRDLLLGDQPIMGLQPFPGEVGVGRTERLVAQTDRAARTGATRRPGARRGKRS